MLDNSHSVPIAHTGSSYVLTKIGDLVFSDLPHVSQLTKSHIS